MDFHVMTLFPDMIMQGLSDSVIGRAVRKETIGLHAVNIRDYSHDKHKHVDDYPYAGGAGMVMQPEPIFECYQDIVARMDKKPRVIYMTPQGRVFNQEIAEELSKEESLIFLCGHYEGVDQRILDELIDEEISIGDYVLTGGELPAMVLMDSVMRHVEGVLGTDESTSEESFSMAGLLEYPQYTRPADFRGRKVPEILLSGHHANIKAWQRRQAILKTAAQRPELLETAELTPEERAEFLK